MRHRKAGRKLGRNSSHRRAVLRNMVTSLFKYEQIETTHAKAKEIRPIVEKMITLAKRGDLHARRQALSFMQDKGVTHKLFEESKDRFVGRQGGYTRIIRSGFRKGDGSPVAIVQLIKDETAKKKSKKKSSTPAKKAEAPKKAESKAPEDKKEKVEEKETPQVESEKKDSVEEEVE